MKVKKPRGIYLKTDSQSVFINLLMSSLESNNVRDLISKVDKYVYQGKKYFYIYKISIDLNKLEVYYIKQLSNILFDEYYILKFESANELNNFFDKYIEKILTEPEKVKVSKVGSKFINIRTTSKDQFLLNIDHYDKVNLTVLGNELTYLTDKKSVTFIGTSSHQSNKFYSEL